MKKGITSILSGCLLAFYIGIIMYVFFAVLHRDTLANFTCAMAFELIGFLLLAGFIMGNILFQRIKTGFFVPLIVITVIYTILLHVVNIAFIAAVPTVFFVLINFCLLFIYCLLSMPMYIMGRK